MNIVSLKLIKENYLDQDVKSPDNVYKLLRQFFVDVDLNIFLLFA